MNEYNIPHRNIYNNIIQCKALLKLPILTLFPDIF
jgi:hypothetical protein